MTIKGKIKEGAGYVEEEIGEKTGNTDMAYKGRSTRNEGRIEDGKQPMVTPPGTTGDKK